MKKYFVTIQINGIIVNAAISENPILFLMNQRLEYPNSIVLLFYTEIDIRAYLTYRKRNTDLLKYSPTDDPLIGEEEIDEEMAALVGFRG